MPDTVPSGSRRGSGDTHAGGNTSSLYGTNEGVRLTVWSTHHTLYALHAQPPVEEIATQFVRQCVRDFRDALLLGRAWLDTAVGDSDSSKAGMLESRDAMVLLAHTLRVEHHEVQHEADEAPPPAVYGRRQIQEELLRLLWREQQQAVGAASASSAAESGPAALLSTLPRVKPMVADLCTLAEHLLIPYEVLRQRQQWLCLSEDVQLTWGDRLHHWRVVLRGESGPRPEELAELWEQCWEVLGAAWRQRERLLGAYRHVEGPRALPPLTLSADGTLPPSPATALHQLERYERRLSSGGRGSYSMPEVGTPKKGAAEEDTCGFGPITPQKVGISTKQQYVIRDGLAAVRRHLRVAAPEGPRTAGFAFKGAVHKYQYAQEILSAPHSPAPSNLATFSHQAGGSSSNGQLDTLAPNSRTESVFDPAQAQPTAPATAPFFATTKEDVAEAAVPYLSPELYAAHISATPSAPVSVPVHRLSDDVWSITVLFVEGCLATFDVTNIRHCHLATLLATEEGQHRRRKSHALPSASVFADLLYVLHHHAELPLRAAQSFLYSALYHLQRLTSAWRATGSEEERTWLLRAHPTALGPPLDAEGLAREWLAVVVRQYGVAWSQHTFAERVRTGLCWRREERWQNFVAAHAGVQGGVESESDVDRTPPTPDLFTVSGPPSALKAPARLVSASASMGNLTMLDLSSSSSATRHSSKFHRRLRQAELLLNCLRTPFLQQLFALTEESEEKAEDQEKQEEGLMWQPLPSATHCDAVSFWPAFVRWRRAVEEQAAAAASGTAGSLDTRQSVSFTEVVRLAREGIRLIAKKELSARGARPAEVDESTWRYHVARHPFLQNVVAHSQLAYLAHQADPAAPPLPGATVWFPWPLFFRLLHASEAAHLQVEPSAQQLGSLQGLITEPARAQGPARRGRATTTAVTLQQEVMSHLSFVNDVCFTTQLELVRSLRAFLLGQHNSLSSTERAAQLRQHLLAEQAQRQCALVPVPGTLRGELWAVLLEVPSARKREALFATVNTTLRTVFDRQIAMDLPRCHPYHVALSTEEGRGRLCTVLKACLRLRPQWSYWQGMDTVAAVALSVSGSDVALATLLLVRLISRFIPPQEHQGDSGGGGGGAGSTRAAMEERLLQLQVFLRYCDPLLACHLFDTLQCGPELFAVPWLLTLFAHREPLQRVYPLWDYVLVRSGSHPHVLTALCVVALMQRRAQLLSQGDFAGALASLSGPADLHVAALLRDTELLLQAVPPVIGALPFDEDGGQWRGAVHRASVALMDAATLAAALQPSTAPAAISRGWVDGGVYVIDLRGPTSGGTPMSSLGDVTAGSPPAPRERLLGSLSIPVPAPPALEVGEVPTPRHYELHAQRIEAAAGEVLRQLCNGPMAAVMPRPGLAESLPAAAGGQTGAAAAAATTQADGWAEQTAGTAPVNVAVCKTYMAPHVVLLADSAYFAGGQPPSATRMHWRSAHRPQHEEEVQAMEAWSYRQSLDHIIAHRVGLKLNEYGVHNVSVLLGGFDAIRTEAPDLVVHVAESNKSKDESKQEEVKEK